MNDRKEWLERNETQYRNNLSCMEECRESTMRIYVDIIERFGNRDWISEIDETDDEKMIRWRKSRHQLQIGLCDLALMNIRKRKLDKMK